MARGDDVITSTANRSVRLVRALQQKRRARQEEGLFVVEGTRWAEEVVAAGAPVRLVLHTDHLSARERGLVNQTARTGAEVRVVSEAVMAACSATESPPGLLMVLPIPALPLPERLTLALVVDGVRDPGNLGTLLRTALAAGVEAAFLTPGTVDPYNPKVVRAAMGAHLRLPLRTVEPADLPQALQGLQVWLAEARQGHPYYAVDWRQPVALVVGGEAQGPSAALRGLAHGQVHVPTPGEVESLNVAIATAVILFEIVRQRGLP